MADALAERASAQLLISYASSTGKLLTVLGFSAEEWNHEFFEANPSRECDEKPEHGEEHNCRSFVWLLGKWW